MPDTSTNPASSAQCDECGAPVAEEQRYCVACGAHRKHVNDPAARYLSQASARSRVTRAARTARRAPASVSGSRGLGIALALALIPAAAAGGVLVGRSSGNRDAGLIAALSREQAAVGRATASGTTATTVASAGNGAGGATATSTPGSHHATSKHRTGHGRHHTTTHHHATTATAISTAPPTAAAKATGAKVTQKVQKSTGKSYVNGQSNLPGTVVVP